MPLNIFKEKPSPKILGIAAGKGGVGKSTMTALLALQLKSMGYKVGVLDCDLYGPSLRKMLPEDRMPGRREDKFFPAIAGGILILSLDHFDKISSSVRAPIANHWIDQLLFNVTWGPLDFLLIDFPPGTGDIPLTLCEKGRLDGAILVTTPQEIALQDVKRAAQLFRQVKIPILGIIENMSYFCPGFGQERCYPFGHGGASQLGLPILGEMPIDPSLSQGADLGFNRILTPHKLWGKDTVIEEVAEKIIKYWPQEVHVHRV